MKTNYDSVAEKLLQMSEELMYKSQTITANDRHLVETLYNRISFRENHGWNRTSRGMKRLIIEEHKTVLRLLTHIQRLEDRLYKSYLRADVCASMMQKGYEKMAQAMNQALLQRKGMHRLLKLPIQPAVLSNKYNGKVLELKHDAVKTAKARVRRIYRKNSNNGFKSVMSALLENPGT